MDGFFLEPLNTTYTSNESLGQKNPNRKCLPQCDVNEDLIYLFSTICSLNTEDVFLSLFNEEIGQFSKEQKTIKQKRHLEFCSYFLQSFSNINNMLKYCFDI